MKKEEERALLVDRFRFRILKLSGLNITTKNIKGINVVYRLLESLFSVRTITVQ